MSGATFALRTAAWTLPRRPTFWVIALVWLLLMWSSSPPGTDPANPSPGSWLTLGLSTPGWFAVELTIFHLLVSADFWLAARAAGVPLFAGMHLGARRWTAAVVMCAAAGAAVHLLAWCAVTGVKCWARNDRVDWSLAADPQRAFPGLGAGTSTLLLLAGALFTLTLVGLLVAGLVHAVASSAAIIAAVGLWCLLEVPVTFAELGLRLFRYVDPALVAGPDALLLYAGAPSRFGPAAAVAAVWLVAALLPVLGARRLRAVAAPR
ncbi:MAG: hypothetical protein ACT4RN_02935 [Pseudonocardia sp.]